MAKMKSHSGTKFALSLMLAVSALSAAAEMVPTPLTGDTRLVTFEYDPENTYLVLSKPKSHTHIMMPEGELLESVMAGDTASWEITPSKNLKHLFIKPKYEDIETTLTILTTGKTFQVVIRSTGEGRKWYQQVAWEVPKGFVFDLSGKEPNKELLTGSEVRRQPSQSQDLGLSIDPTKLNYAYIVSGSENFKPTQVFDDGKKIWLQMPKGLVEMPAVFAKEGKDLVLVNYLVKNDFVQIQQLVERIVLKIDSREVVIDKGEKSFWGGRSKSWAE